MILITKWFLTEVIQDIQVFLQAGIPCFWALSFLVKNNNGNILRRYENLYLYNDIPPDGLDRLVLIERLNI